MRRLIYWAAQCNDDSSAYNVRERKRRDAVAKQQEANRHKAGAYGPVTKVEITYIDSFDLMQQCMGEAGPELSLPSGDNPAESRRVE